MRMGRRMREVLEALRSLGDADKDRQHGYTQTEIIFQAMGLEPYKRVYRTGHEAYIVPPNKVDNVIAKSIDRIFMLFLGTS